MKKKNILRFVEQPRKDREKKPADIRKKEFAEIYEPSKETDLQEQADRCMSCGTPFCQWKCPVHNYIPDWLQMAYQGNLEEAVELCHETNSLPEICGRVCPQDRLCEGACTLNDGIGAVTIGSTEKYITDTMLEKNWRPDLSKVKKINKKVAVVGAGPAGLACADVLIRNGITPVVFDSYSEIGGLLTFGIPEFKLEKSVMQRRRKFFEDLGIEFKLNTTIGKDIEIQDLEKDFDSIFLGLGTYSQVSAGLANNDLAVKSLDFLVGSVSKNLGIKSEFDTVDVKGKNVVVLGGGDTAMDCVRTAIRLGAKNVKCVYRRNAEDMPGSKKEVINATEEGANFLFNCQPIGIEATNNTLTGVKIIKTKLEKENERKEIYSEWDKLIQESIGCTLPDSKNKLITIDGSEEIIEADIVITAFGFRAKKYEWLQKVGVETNDYNLIKVKEAKEELEMQTSNSKIFAAGDIVTGADLVVTAIAAGRKAGESIIKLLTS
jgi:glutamate synthase (NADPH/NADH) small chain